MKKDYFFNLSILAIVFIYVFYLSYNAIWMGDDIYYGYHCQSSETINSFRDIIDSQIWHYLNVNGRFVAHVLVQLSIAVFGKAVFALLNSFVYVLLIIGVFKLTKTSWLNISAFVFVAFGVLFAFQTKFVPSCQVGYVWMGCMLVWMLHIFFNKWSWSYGHLLWLAPFSFLTGWGQEAFNIGVCAALCLYAAFNFKKISVLQWVILISFILGTLMIIVSPGSHKRLENSTGHISFMKTMLYSVYNFVTLSRILYLFLFLVLYQIWNKQYSIRELIKDYRFYVYIISASILYAMMFYIGIQSNRMLFGSEFMLLIVCVYLFSKISYSCRICILSFFSFFVIYKSYYNVSFLHERKSIYINIVEQYEEGNGIVYFDLDDKMVAIKHNDPGYGFGKYDLIMLESKLQKDYETDKELYILPQNTTSVNTVSMPTKGHYFAYISKDNKVKSIGIERFWNIFGMKIQKPMLFLDLNKPVWENDSIKAIQFIEPHIPFDHFGEATITYNE